MANTNTTTTYVPPEIGSVGEGGDEPFTTTTTTTTLPPSDIVYPSDPDYPIALVEEWIASGITPTVALELNGKYEPIISSLYLEQFYKYYSTAGRRLYKKDPNKVFDYSMFANQPVDIKEGDVTYKVYTLKGKFFNNVIRRDAANRGANASEDMTWSVVYDRNGVFYSITENADEYLFCRSGSIGNDNTPVDFYGVTFKGGKYIRVNEIKLRLTRANGNVSGLKFMSGEETCIDIDDLYGNLGIDESFNNIIKVKTFSLSEMDGFLDLESQLWVKDNDLVRRTYYDTTNHCYIEINNDMEFVNSFMNSATNRNALIKTRDEFDDESFAIIPFTQWYRSGGYKVPTPGQV